MFLLLLGLTSAKSRPHVQLIRAELPSKGSSEPLSESLSKLSSHQIPHSLGSEGSTTAKGLYAYSFFVLNHYAFGGVRAQALSVLVLSTSTSTTESSWRVPAARVPPRSPCPGHPLRFSRACPLVTYEAFPCPVDSLPPTRLWYGSACPSSLPTSSLLQASMRGGYVFQGVRRCFPGAIDTEFGHRNSYVFLTESLIHGDPVNRGVRTSFPGRD